MPRPQGGDGGAAGAVDVPELKLSEEQAPHSLSLTALSLFPAALAGVFLRQALLAEITDPYLQNDIQSLVHAVVMADGHLADGEAELVDTLWTRWQGQHIDIGSGS